jgi:hypothetical protein
MAFGHLLYDRTEEAVLLLEARIIFGKELVEVMEEHSVEDDAPGMTRAIDSWHSRSHRSRNEPIPGKKANR